jgi:hypothetical protein
MNGTPKSCYYVNPPRNTGLPTGREPYGNRAPIAGPEPGIPGRAEQVVKDGKAVIMAKGRRSLGNPNHEVCKVQKAEVILGIIHERGKRGLPLENVYRLLFNPELFLLAYGKIYRNQGAMTPGTTSETVD